MTLVAGLGSGPAWGFRPEPEASRAAFNAAHASHSTADSKTLLAWHKAHVLDESERHWSAAIFEVHGNRNLLIDHPEWEGKLDAANGLAG